MLDLERFPKQLPRVLILLICVLLKPEVGHLKYGIHHKIPKVVW